MKMKRFDVTFEATMYMTVYAPEGTAPEKIEEIAREIAEKPRSSGWDMPEFEAIVSQPKDVEVPDADLVKDPPNAHGYRNVTKGPMAREDVVVLNDAGDDLVCPSDATWWERT
jgi:hypothetical protein